MTDREEHPAPNHETSDSTQTLAKVNGDTETLERREEGRRRNAEKQEAERFFLREFI